MKAILAAVPLVFRASGDHPWLLKSGQWASTEELKVGDHLKTATGIDLVVATVKPTGKTEAIYNLTVANLHTFLIGKNHLVVHNTCADEIFDASGKLTKKAIDGSRPIIPRSRMGDVNIPAGFDKYATATFSTSSGNAQVHFLMNPKTGQILYDYTYKTVANSKGQIWGVP